MSARKRKKARQAFARAQRLAEAHAREDSPNSESYTPIKRTVSKRKELRRQSYVSMYWPSQEEVLADVEKALAFPQEEKK